MNITNLSRIVHRNSTTKVLVLVIVILILLILRQRTLDASITSQTHDELSIEDNNGGEGGKRKHTIKDGESPQGVKGEDISTKSTHPRIFCAILTTSGSNHKREAVESTWAQRCDHYCFFYAASEQSPGGLGSCVLNVQGGRGHLTSKVLSAFHYINKHYHKQFDWILKADDDTYVIIENLRSFLSQFQPSEGHFFGHKFNHMRMVIQGHNSGGAGYVLSAYAVEAILSDGLLSSSYNCPQDGGIEDLQVSMCLAFLGIVPGKSTDENGLMTFHPENPFIILKKSDDAHFSYTKRRMSFGMGTNKMMSPHTISFHHLDPATIYVIDFLLYDLKRGQNDKQAAITNQ